MNKIYKVIWSKVKNCHIVVSEIAGACGRSSTRGAKRAAAAMAVLCLLSAGGSGLTLAAGTEALKYLSVSPAGPSGDAVATGGGSVAVGQGSLADGHQGTAVGLESHAGQFSFAGGSKANAVSSGVAVGYEAKAAGAQSIAIGTGRRIDQANRIYEMAQAGYSVAIGSSSHVDKDSNSAIALGVNADVINSAAATALGAGAKVENVAYGLALGGKASVIDGDYGIALGAFSMADRAGGVSGYDPSTGKASTDASLAWKSADGYGALSIGNDFKTRQIINVAAGSQDTDAVNVAQLKALDTKLGTQITNLSTRKTPFVSINGKSGDGNVNGDGATGASAIAIGPEVTAKGDYGVALGGWTHATGNKGIAVGVLSNASANQSTAIGTGANASANDTVAIGTSTEASVFNAIALGASAKSKQSGGLAAGAKAEVASTGYNGIAVGANAYVGPKTDANPPDHSVPGDGALVGDDVNDKEPTTGGMTEQNAMAIGQNAKAFGYQNTSIGAGAETHDTNTLAVGILAVAKGHYSVAIGKQAKTFAEKAIAAGWHASADEVSAAAYGERAHAEKANSLALGANARAMEEASVALGSGSLASGAKDGKAAFSGEEVSAKAGIVSVGNPTYKITPRGGQETEVQASYRRITNMAGGIDDHDAVNVAQLKALDKKLDGSTVHYYSANSSKIETGSNYANDGAKAQDSIVLGISSTSEGANSTVIGNNNILTGNKNERNNSVVVGQNLTVEGTYNAVFGTDYRNYDNKITHVAGEQNTVIGVGNLVGYRAEKNPSDPTKWIYTKVGTSGSDQNVAVGVLNTANDGSLAVGTSSEVDNLGSAFGHGNTVIGSGNGGGQWGVALGNNLVAKGEMALAIGNENKAIGNWAVAIGSRSSTAKQMDIAMGFQANASGGQSIAMGAYSMASGLKGIAMGAGAKAAVNNGVALGSGSIADREAGEKGYDPSTKAKSTETSAAWQSTLGAVSVGSETQGETRQITNVAAGSEDTDAVNVAQLKKAVAGAADGNTTYTLEGKENKDNNTTTITFTGSDSTKTEVTVATKDTTLKAGSSGLSVADGKLNMTVEDTSGHTVTGSVDLSAIAAGAADGNTTYTLEGKENKDNNTTTITLTGSDNKKTEVTVATKDTRNTVKAGENVKLTEANNALGGTEYTIDVKADGKVENGNTGIVTGGTVYNETRVKEDGTYVKQTNSAGDNLTLLDKQVAGNTSSIASLQNNFHEIDRNLSKVGAGAAALAALHPLDFDPEDKWDFSAGFGNYRDASAVAVGAFYRPNERTMLSIGATLGDNRNLFNAGLSVKLGSGKAPASMSRAHMVETIRRQENEIQAMKAKDAERDARDAERDAQLEAVMKELKALKAEK